MHGNVPKFVQANRDARCQAGYFEKSVEIALTAGSILDDREDAIDPRDDGLGGSVIDEGNDGLPMLTKGVDKFARGLQTVQ